jgi:hypothetical protein
VPEVDLDKIELLRLGTFLYPSWFGTVRHVSVTRPVPRVLNAIIMESFGGLAPGAVSLLDELARAHGSRLGKDELSAPWCARSFKRLHAMRITIALHCAAAEEILQTVHLDAAADAQAA